MIFPWNKKDWKKFASNNRSIALNILYLPYNTEEIRHSCKLKYILKLEVVIMITDCEKNGIILL